MSEPLTTAVELLTASDHDELRAFEVENREFFARAVGDRGDDYFASFTQRHRALVEENLDGTSLLFLVRDGSGRLVGRVNITDIDDPLPELGYRIAERDGGRGHARRAVATALTVARERGVVAVRAMTTAGNTASRKVLEATGFQPRPGSDPAEIEINGRVEPVVHYVVVLS